MDVSLLQAIDTLVVAVDAGTLAKPREGTVAWWLLRANSTSLSMLRAIKQRDMDPVQAETFRKKIRSYMMDPEKELDADMGAEQSTSLPKIPTGIEPVDSEATLPPK